MGGRRAFGSVRRLPSGRWQVRYYGPDGVRRSAEQTFRAKADATSYLATLESDVLRGVWRAPETSRVLVRAYAARWVQMNPRLKRSTRALYEDLLRMWIDPFLGGLRLSDLSPAKVREWHAEISAQTGKTRVAQAYRLLRAITNTGVADGVLASNPCHIDGAGPARRGRFTCSRSLSSKRRWRSFRRATAASCKYSSGPGCASVRPRSSAERTSTWPPELSRSSAVCTGSPQQASTTSTFPHPRPVVGSFIFRRR